MLVQRSRGFTLIEVITATFILVFIGLMLVGFVASSYDMGDVLTGTNTASAGTRAALDSMADNIRNAQWCTGAATPSSIEAGASNSITIYNSITVSTSYTTFSLSGTTLQKSVTVSGGTPVVTTVATGVTSLTLGYYTSTSYSTAVTAPVSAANLPSLKMISLTATVTDTEMSTYSRSYQTVVWLRNTHS